jgi:hypothetical protein
VVGRDGQVRNKRACFEGPVFNGARIDWERWGIALAAPVPADPDEEEAEDDAPATPLSDAELWGTP